jgi:hypothetical protein
MTKLHAAANGNKSRESPLVTGIEHPRTGRVQMVGKEDKACVHHDMLLCTTPKEDFIDWNITKIWKGHCSMWPGKCCITEGLRTHQPHRQKGYKYREGGIEDTLPLQIMVLFVLTFLPSFLIVACMW